MHTVTVTLVTKHDFPKCLFDHNLTTLCQAGAQIPIVRTSALAGKLLSPFGKDNTNVRFVCGTRHYSLFKQLQLGIADFTGLYMTLTPERNEKFSYADVIYSEGNSVIFKKSHAKEIMFDPFEILPWKCMLMLLVFALCWKIAKAATNKWSWSGTIFTRSSLILGLAIQLLLGYMASNVVLMFNRSPPRIKQFKTLLDVANAVYEGNLIPLTVSQLAAEKFFFSNLSTPLSIPIKILHDSAKIHGPPRAGISTTEAIQLIESSHPKPYVYIAGQLHLAELLSLSCEIDYFIDRTFVSRKSVYFRKNMTVNHFGIEEIVVLRTEIEQAYKSYYKPKTCNIEPSVMLPTNIIRLEQIIIAPLLIIAAAILGLIALSLEHFLSLLCSLIIPERSNG